MKRAALFLLPLVLAGCQQLSFVIPEDVPPLREAAMGETLNLTGKVENWTPGQPVQIWLEEQAVGQLKADGAFSVATAWVPPFLRKAEDVLLPILSIAGDEQSCSLRTLTVSDPGAQAYRTYTFDLKASAAQSLTPQLSPVPPLPQLMRQQGGTAVALVYADRNVGLMGQKVCKGRTWDGHSTWVQASAINVQLRRGWNTVSLTSENRTDDPAGRLQRYSLVVQGGDVRSAANWRYNGVPLP